MWVRSNKDSRPLPGPAARRIGAGGPRRRRGTGSWGTTVGQADRAYVAGYYAGFARPNVGPRRSVGRMRSG